MKRTCLIHCLCASLLLAATAASAETTFITDKLSVELFSSTFQRGIVVTTVKTGAIVEVIDTDGDFRKVRTQDGQEGWLHSKYLSTEKPTQVNYLQLMAKHQLLEQELQQLRNDSANSAELEKQQAVLAKTRNDLNQAQKTISGLQSELKAKASALEQNQQQLAALQAQAKQTEQKAAATPAETPAETKAAEEPPATPVETSPMQASMPVNPEFNLDYPIALKWLLAAMLLSILLGGYLGYSWLDNKIAKRHGGVRIR